MKTRQDNNLTYHIGALYVEDYTKLSGPIGMGAVYMKTRKNNDVIDLTSVVYIEKETKLSWLIVNYSDQSYRCNLCLKWI